MFITKYKSFRKYDTLLYKKMIKYDYTILKDGSAVKECKDVKECCSYLNSMYETDIYTFDKIVNYFKRNCKSQKGFKNLELQRVKVVKKKTSQKIKNVNNEVEIHNQQPCLSN